MPTPTTTPTKTIKRKRIVQSGSGGGDFCGVVIVNPVYYLSIAAVCLEPLTKSRISTHESGQMINYDSTAKNSNWRKVSPFRSGPYASSDNQTSKIVSFFHPFRDALADCAAFRNVMDKPGFIVSEYP